MSRLLNPYNVIPNNTGYDFFTDYNLSYFVYFNQNKNYFIKSPELNNSVYDFGFERNEENHSDFDVRIEHTLISIVKDFFIKNPTAILCYICDGSDNFEIHRYRIFNIWYYRHLLTECEKLNFDLSGLKIYGAVLISENNPYKAFIKEAFFKEFD